MAFTSLVENAPRGSIENLINVALGEFIELLNDKSSRVKMNGAKLISKISENYPQTILMN